MLLINARKGPSRIHGLGLFANEFIPAGTVMWVLRPEFDVVLTEEQFQSLSPVAQEQVRYYCYYDPRHRTYVLSSDDDRFTNHSDQANSVLDADGMSTVALRDIHSGEEITWDYRAWGGIDFTVGAGPGRGQDAEPDGVAR